MPTKKLPEQNGNSCAAHCTVIAINELTNQSLDQTFAESTLWPKIQFVADQSKPSTILLAAQKNSDPRLIVQEVKSRWQGVSAKLLCDSTQKTTAMTFVNPTLRPQLSTLFDELTQSAVAAPTQLDEGAFYNCSYTMHDSASPLATTFTGLHNILVTYSGGKAWYYNSNESSPSWQTTTDWKTLSAQNGGNNSYVFTGVSVVLY